METNKDWKGNTHAVFITLGATNHSDSTRESRDYYATDPKAMMLLLEREKFSPTVWENAVGEGHLAEVLKENGYKVKCSDIVDRGYPNTEILDFLEYVPEKEMAIDIVTNPPYKYAKQFVEKSLECVENGHKVAMFLRLQFLEGKQRRLLFDKNPPKRVYVCSGRIDCAKNGDFKRLKENGGAAAAYAWFVWQKGYTGKPTIEWIN